MKAARFFRASRIRTILVVVFALMQVYLLAIRKHDTLFLDVYPNDTPGPRLLGPRIVGQTFAVKKNALARIDLMVGTYGQEIAGDLVFRLFETNPAKTLIVEKSIPGSALKNNLYVPFRFKPVRHSRGKEFLFEVGAPDAAPDRSVSLWMNSKDIYREGRAFFNGESASGDVVFRAYARRTVLAELGRITAKYPGFLGSPFALVTVILFFEAIQVYFFWALLGFFFDRKREEPHA